MTMGEQPDDYDFMLGDPADEDGDEWEAWEEEQRRRYETCAERIIACHTWVEQKLGEYGGPNEAWNLFAEFVRCCQPKSKRGRPARHSHPERDALLLKAYREAPAGQKRARVIATGSAYKMSADAAWRQLRRLRQEEHEKKAAAETMAQSFKKLATSH